MELYNPIIREVEALAGASTPKRYAYDPAEAWEDTGLSSWSCCGTPPMSWAAAAKAR